MLVCGSLCLHLQIPDNNHHPTTTTVATATNLLNYILASQLNNPHPLLRRGWAAVDY